MSGKFDFINAELERSKAAKERRKTDSSQNHEKNQSERASNKEIFAKAEDVQKEDNAERSEAFTPAEASSDQNTLKISEDFSDTLSEDEEEYERYRRFAEENRNVSIAILQRKFGIGYSKASRIMERLKREKSISYRNGFKTSEMEKESSSETKNSEENENSQNASPGRASSLSESLNDKEDRNITEPLNASQKASMRAENVYRDDSESYSEHESHAEAIQASEGFPDLSESSEHEENVQKMMAVHEVSEAHQENTETPIDVRKMWKSPLTSDSVSEEKETGEENYKWLMESMQRLESSGILNGNSETYPEGKRESDRTNGRIQDNMKTEEVQKIQGNGSEGLKRFCNENIFYIVVIVLLSVSLLIEAFLLGKMF